jgi:hypothetical protein
MKGILLDYHDRDYPHSEQWLPSNKTSSIDSGMQLAREVSDRSSSNSLPSFE